MSSLRSGEVTSVFPWEIPPDIKRLTREEAIRMIAESVAKRKRLGYGQLDGENGEHCAVGCLWADNDKVTIPDGLINTVAKINDKDEKETPEKRWARVSRWLKSQVKKLDNHVTNRVYKAA
jgi:hypothetical protein